MIQLYFLPIQNVARRTAAVPGERITKYLSERVLTAAGIPADYCYDSCVKCLAARSRCCIELTISCVS